MIPKECKRLADVDFPIAVVSEHSTAKTSPSGRRSECRGFAHEQQRESIRRLAARTHREL